MLTGAKADVSALRSRFQTAETNPTEKQRVFIPRAESVGATRAKFLNGDANNASQKHEQDAAFARSVAKLQELEAQRARDEEAASIALAMQLQAEEDAQINRPSFG